MRHGLTLRYAFKTYHTISLWNLVSWHIVSQNSELIKFHLLAHTHTQHPTNHPPTQPNSERTQKHGKKIHRIRFSPSSTGLLLLNNNNDDGDVCNVTHKWEEMLKSKMPSVCFLCRGNDNGHTDTGVPWASACSVQRVRFLLLVRRVASTTKDVCTRTQCRGEGRR